MQKSSYRLARRSGLPPFTPICYAPSFLAVAFTVLTLMFSVPALAVGESAKYPPKPENSGVVKTLRIQALMQTSALGDAAITAILSQKNGQLWVAEQSGLHMHDGKKLISFTTIDPHQKYYAPSLDISSITQDSKGGVWASSRSTGITRYNSEKQVFENLERLPASDVSEIVFMAHDTLIYIHSGTIKAHRASSNSHLTNIQEHAITTGAVSNLLVETESKLIVYAELGTFRIDLTDNSIEEIAPQFMYTVDDQTAFKAKVSDTGNHFFLPKGSAVGVPQSGVSSEIGNGLSLSPVTTATAVHKGLSFAGTDKGLYVFQKDGSFIEKYTTHNSGLTNDHVTHLHSNGDTLWIGTYEGLSYLTISDFELYNYHSDSISNEILNFSEDESGKIWLGTYHGLFRFDPENLEHQPFSHMFPKISLVDNRVMALDVSGREIFIGTRRSGLLILDTASREVIKHTISGNRDLQVTQVLRLSDSNALISSFNDGVYSLEKYSRGNGTEYVASKVIDDTITLLKKHANSVLAANETGVYLYDPGSHRVSPLSLLFPLQNVQPTITAVHSISENLILIGTQSHGLFSVNLENKKGQFLDAQSTLQEVHAYAAAVYSIEQDEENRIWIATSNGLFLFSRDFEFLLRYNTADGLQGNKFNFGSSLLDSRGFLYFGGSRGYNRFRPSEIPTSTSSPSVVMTRINIPGSEGPEISTGEWLDSITLSHKDRFITFEFSALDYTDPESTLYRHKLVGFDTDWVDIGNRGSATYTNLPAGDYVFRVQAVNSAGIWNYDGLAIDLRVNPAPWLTWWAFMAYILAAIGVAAWFLRFYRRNMLRDQQLKQATEMQRIADRIADELQDQIDFQSKFTDSVHSYNKALLYWARFCTDSTIEYERSVKQRVHDRILFRLGVLEIIQDSLYHQGERLYVRLHDCATKLSNTVCESHPQVRDRLTVVNDIQKELIPAAQAIPLAIMLAELIDNSMTHAFDGKAATCFVRFSVTLAANPDSSSDTVSLIYQDDGVGVPSGLTLESPESAGFAIIGHAAESLQCDLAIGEMDRTTITGRFNLPWG